MPRLNRASGRWLLLPALVLLTGCAQLGPDLLKAGRSDYNQVLAQTNDEEVLLNLVRLRYADSPVFLDVASVSTSFSWAQGVSASGEAFESGSVDSNLGVRGTAEYSERPTVTYTPLGGADFVKNVLTPLDLDILMLLSRSGWSNERLMRLVVNRISGIENAPEASGPTPSGAPQFREFQEVAQLLEAVQKRRLLTFGYRVAQDGTRSAGARIGAGGGEAPEIAALAERLGVDPGLEVITLDTRGRVRRPDAIGLELRSLAGVLFFLSHGVQIPEADLASGRVTITRDETGAPFDWSQVLGDLFVVRSSAEPPGNAAVSVRYRGSWFYIDDSDLQSKYTFMLLGQIAALQAGEVERAGPVLTLPVTGG